MVRDERAQESERAARGADASSRAFRLVRAVARLMLRTQYRRIEAEGTQRVPAEGAVLLVANHFSSLVDTMALLDASPRPASFLAKAPLFRSWLLKPFLKGAGAVPVYRPQDQAENEGRSVRANLEVFERCRQRLVAGGSIALFPEGISHATPRLMPLRTGAARIVIDAGVPVALCPVGLVYHSAADGRRGTLLVSFGEPLRVEGTEGYGSRRAAIAGVTRLVEQRMRALLAEAESLDELAELETLRVVWEQERGEETPATLVEAHRRNRVFAHALARLREDAPKALDQLRAATDAYMRSLGEAGIPARDLDAEYGARRIARFLLLKGPLLLLGVPAGLVAALVTWPVRAIGDIVALRSFGGTQDVRTLCRILGAGLLLVLLMVGGGLAATLLWSWRVGLGVFLALPALLAYHVLWRDHSRAARTSLRCWALLAGSNLRVTLWNQRRALYERLLTVGAHLRDGVPSDAQADQASRS